MFGSSQSFGSSSPFSASQATMPMGGMGMGGSPGAQDRKPRQEEKQTILPVTVRAVEVAVAERPADGELELFGSVPGQLILVGMVEVPTAQTSSVEFVLNDGTGRMRVRHYCTDGGVEPIEAAQAGRYVIAIGQVRFSPEVHFTATCLRATKSADEVSYHSIEAAHAALRLRRGAAPLSTKMSAAAPVLAVPRSLDSSMAAVAPAVVLAAAPAATPAAAPVAVAAPTLSSEQLLAYLRKAGEERPEGVAFTVLCGQFSGSKEAEVRKLMDKLMEEGEAFTTIDDEHFSAI